MSLTAIELLELIDRLSGDSSRVQLLGSGNDLYRAAVDEGLVDASVQQDFFAEALGQLVEDDLIKFGSQMGGAFFVAKGAPWGIRELNGHFNFRPTPSGRQSASNFRIQKRESARLQRTEDLRQALRHVETLDNGQQDALHRLRSALERALENEDDREIIGAAKDLIEGTSRAVIVACGGTYSTSDSLGKQFNQAREISRPEQEAKGVRTLGRSLAGAIEGINQLRNERGTGHGQIDLEGEVLAEAKLASATAIALTDFLLFPLMKHQ